MPKTFWFNLRLVGISVFILLGCHSRALASIKLSDWTGQWSCNLDGRPAVLILRLEGNRIVGRINDDNRGWVSIVQRQFDSNDPATPRRDHLLPLLFGNTDNWMLMMHTWNTNYASGYTTWRGIPFGVQCRRAS